MQASRILKLALLIPIAAVGFVALFGWVVMLLWNHVLTDVLPVGAVTFWQAIGITLLAKILFGGIPGKQGPGCQPRGSGGGCCRDDDDKDCMAGLTDEERQALRAEVKRRFGGWPRPQPGSQGDATGPGSGDKTGAG